MNANFPGFLRGAWTLVLLGATGCKKDGSLWLLLFEPNTDPTTCESTVTHNFNDASPIVDEPVEGAWIVTQELTQSDSAVIGEVTGGSDPVLVISARLWTGTKDGSSTTFVWKSEETSSSSQTATKTDYAYTNNFSNQIEEKIKLEFKGNEASGTYTTTQTLNQSWSETDSFDWKAVGFNPGQIPAASYLLVSGPGPGGKLVPVYNTADEVECATTVCQLNLVSTCDMSVKVTATELDVDDENYDGIGGAYRPAGVPGFDGDDTGWWE